LHKMNVLHFHLSDDQGWRIESARHPELHLVGSMWDAELAPMERGGYYTRAELVAIVAHARRLGIEVVPEVDMPGHSVAILRALPELACSPSPDAVRERAEFRITPWFEGPLIHEEVLCACDERVYAFVADVLDELVAIFPSPWIHLGGDETPTVEWAESYRCADLVAAGAIDGIADVQAYFSRRVEALVRARGKRLIGWSEVLRNEQASAGRFALSDSFTTMHWNATFDGDPPRLHDRDVIQTPIFTLYLDWYASTSLEQVYAYEPVAAGLTAAEAAHVLGAQGSMWTGFPQQRSLERIDVHLFPKVLAIAELTWSAQDRRDFTDFETRRAVHERRLDVLGVTRGPCIDCRY
jgi:hexosaminidase